jgi:DNA-binding response OmpR family regulator
MLVVSDAERMAQVNLLMRSAAYEVRAAFDGQHALGLLRIDRPEALVVDYELNDMDGVEMLRRLSKQSRGDAPPSLLLLPAGREELRAEALAAGARVVVGLPYDAVELLERLRELCEEGVRE